MSEHQEAFILGGYIMYLLYLTQPVTKYYGAISTSDNFFLYLCLRRTHCTYRASHLFRINIHLPVPYLYGIIVVMILYKFRKQYSLPSKICVCVLHVNDGWIQLLLLNRGRVLYEYYFALAPLPLAPPGGGPCTRYNTRRAALRAALRLLPYSLEDAK